MVAEDEVRTLAGLDARQIMIVMKIPKDNYDDRILIENAFKEEFSENVSVFGDSEVIQSIIK